MKASKALEIATAFNLPLQTPIQSEAVEIGLLANSYPTPESELDSDDENRVKNFVRRLARRGLKIAL
jgi:hypothetical protein